MLTLCNTFQISNVSRKPAPAPIRIPNAAIHGPKVQIQRSANMEPTGEFASHPPTAYSASNSPISTDNMSSISGTTLARALIANSFILSSDVRVSRYRSGMSGMIRQDSATLPRGDHPFLNSPYWRDKRISGGDIILTPNSGRNSGRGSPVPPVPPIPSGSSSLFSRSKSVRNSETGLLSADIRERGTHRQSGTESTKHASASSVRSPRASDPELHPSLVRSSSSSGVTTSKRPSSRRISRIVEVPSPAPSVPGTPRKVGSEPPQNRSNHDRDPSPLMKEALTNDSAHAISTPSPEPRKRPSQRRSQSETSVSPSSSQTPGSSRTYGSTHSNSIGNMLEDYMFMSSSETSRSDPSPMAPESSASITAPIPYRVVPKRASRKRNERKMILSTSSSSLAAGGNGDDLYLLSS